MDYKTAADLFGRYQLVKKSGRVVSSRSTLIGYFAEKMERKPIVIALRLGHLETDQIFALQSAFNDRLARNGKESAQKYFWWVTKLSTVEKS